MNSFPVRHGAYIWTNPVRKGLCANPDLHDGLETADLACGNMDARLERKGARLKPRRPFDFTQDKPLQRQLRILVEWRHQRGSKTDRRSRRML